MQRGLNCWRAINRIPAWITYSACNDMHRSCYHTFTFSLSLQPQGNG